MKKVAVFRGAQLELAHAVDRIQWAETMDTRQSVPAVDIRPKEDVRVIFNKRIDDKELVNNKNWDPYAIIDRIGHDKTIV